MKSNKQYIGNIISTRNIGGICICMVIKKQTMVIINDHHSEFRASYHIFMNKGRHNILLEKLKSRHLDCSW